MDRRASRRGRDDAAAAVGGARRKAARGRGAQRGRGRLHPAAADDGGVRRQNARWPDEAAALPRRR